MTPVREPMLPPFTASDRGRILAQLERLAASGQFEKAARRRELLRWLVTQSLEENAELNERSVASAFYGKGDEFDPLEDASVRVDVSRLRASLEAFYAGEGLNDEVLIAIPRRSYTPQYWGGRPAPVIPPPPAPRPGRRWIWATLAAVLILAAAAVARSGRPEPVVEPVALLPGLVEQPSLDPGRNRVAFVWQEAHDRNPRIYVKALSRPGGLAAITQAGAYSSPAWSPDGLTVAYLSQTGEGQEIRLAPVGGGPHRRLAFVRTRVAGIAWTRDSRHVIAPDAGADGLALYAISVTSGARLRLTGDRNYFHPAVSPDGNTLAFATDALPGRQGGIATLPLAAGATPGGVVRVLEATVSVRAEWPTWSPDGGSILYARSLLEGTALWRYRLASGKADPEPAAGSGVVFGTEMDRGRFLVTRRRERTHLVRIVPGRAPERLFDSAGGDSDGVLSPDGAAIAFTSIRDGEKGLWIANAGGGEPWRAALPKDRLPRARYWSPDSRSLYVEAAASGSPGGRSRIYRIDAMDRAAAPREVELDGGDNIQPSVSRDGRWIYYGSNAGGPFRIWRAPLDRTGPATLVAPEPQPPAGIFAEETADGGTLYFTTASGVSRMAVRGGPAEPVYAGPRVRFRLGYDGLYYQRIGPGLSVPIRLRPFDPGRPEQVIDPGRISAWWTLPGQSGVLATAVQIDSSIEICASPGLFGGWFR